MKNEEEVLQKFRQYGGIINANDERVLMIIIDNRCIEIDKQCKCYYCYDVFKSRPVSTFIKMNEHKLLNELFTIWGWL